MNGCKHHSINLWSLQKVSETDFPIFINIWDSSVRATYAFLPEEEINNLKLLILNEYFHHVLLLYKYVKDEKIVGLIGTSSYWFCRQHRNVIY